MNRRVFYCCALMVAGVAAGSWRACTYDAAWAPFSRPGARHPYITSIDTKIGERVDRLEQETVEQSLSLLSDVELYYWPGSPDANAYPLRFPLAEWIGENDVHVILSNRRVRKVLRELSQLPRNQAGAMVAGAISQEMRQYQRLFDEYLRNSRNREPPPDPSMPVMTPLLQVSPNADGTVVLAGSRLKILSLVCIASTLQLDECRGAVGAVIRDACDTYRDMMRVRNTDQELAFAAIVDASLYNRQILCTAMSRLRMTVDPAGLEWAEHAVGDFTARATPYDLHARGGLVPVDVGANPIVVKSARGISDEEFLHAASALRDDAR